MSYIGNTSTTQAFTPAVDYFSGTGSATAFTLSRPVASVAQVQVTIDNVAQNPSSAYTVSSNTITFTSAPLSGTNNIYVYYTSPITDVIAPGQGTVTATSFVSSTGTGAGVFQTSPTITTPVISSLSSASATALTLQSAGTTAVTIDTSQNVNIGTTGYGALFSGIKAISLGEGSQIYASASGGDPYTTVTSNAFLNSGAAYKYVVTDFASRYEQYNGTHTWHYAPSGTAGNTVTFTEAMRIDSSGNLYIGKTSDTDAVGITLNGTGFLRVNRDGGIPAIFNRNVDNGTLLSCRRSNTTVGSIDVTTTATSYVTSSDYRLKENIAPMTGALAKVTQLKPSTYKWKVDGSDGQGFIAHELQAVVPDCVTGDKDGLDDDGNPKYQGVDTSFLVATLTAAIQELKAINDTQAETINALTARIEALENR